jgi:hypothetical protein
VSTFFDSCDARRLPSRLFYGLAAIAAALTVADLVIYYGGLVDDLGFQRIFAMTREENVPTWYSTLVFFVFASSLWLASRKERSRGRRGPARGFAFLAAFFLYLSADEAARIHERIGNLAADRSLTAGLPGYSWLAVYLPIFGAVALFMLYFLWREWSFPRGRAMLLLGFACLGAALVIEFFEGVTDGYQNFSEALGWPPVRLEHTGKVVEECLENLGTLLLLYASTTHVLRDLDRVEIDLTGRR